MTHYDGHVESAINRTLVEQKEEIKQLVSALKNAEKWVGKLVADKGHLDSVAPQHAIATLDQIDKVLGKYRG